MKTLEYYKALSKALATELEVVAVDLERVTKELDEIRQIKLYWLYMAGMGTVYGDRMFIDYLSILLRQNELIVPQKCKPHLKLVE